MDLPSLPLQGAEWVFVALMGVVLLAPVLARSARLPGILGLILAGILIGPHGLGVLARDGFIELLGGAGLLFLMFMAGLELDLRTSLRERKNDTLLFGGLTFTLPMAVGTAALLLWGFDTLAAVLIASCWASHTLVSYPIFQRFRVVHHRAVAIAIGATMVTNVAAMIVLAVVVALETGGTGPASWATLLGGLALICLANLWALPRVTRWFFAGMGGDRLAHVLFALVMLFAAAALSAAVGIEPIVGAFFAGIGMNQHVPKNGVLGERLTFLGDTLLIPVFLVSVGMIIDPTALFAGTTIVLLALTFTMQSLGGKLAAVLAFGRLRRFDGTEQRTLFSLTAAEAAATLAAIFVGVEVGLFGQEVMDAVVLVIMVTCFVSTVMAGRCAPQLTRPAPTTALGAKVIVPVANPTTAASLTELAAALAAEDSGTVVPINILGRHSGRAAVSEHRDVLIASEAAALSSAVEAHSRVRIDDSTVDGIVHEATEQDATAVLMGWKGYASRREHLFGGLIDELMEQLEIPLVLSRPGTEPRIGRVLVAGPTGASPASLASHRLATDVAARLSVRLQAPVAAVASATGAGELTILRDRVRKVELVATNDPTARGLVDAYRPGDLIVLPATQYQDGELERIAQELPEAHLVVTAA